MALVFPILITDIYSQRHHQLSHRALSQQILHVQAAVLVLVYHAEDLLDALLRGVFVGRELDPGSELGCSCQLHASCENEKVGQGYESHDLALGRNGK